MWLPERDKKRPRAFRDVVLVRAMLNRITIMAARNYSPMVSSDALPPAAVVFTVSVRSPAKRSR
ncbi:hypothetical protein ACVKN3_002968 [Luteibacter sp. PvP120]